MPKRKPPALGQPKARTERIELIRALYIDNYPRALKDSEIESITEAMGFRIPRKAVWQIRNNELRRNIVHTGEHGRYTYRPTPEEYTRAFRIIRIYEELRNVEIHRPDDE